MFFWSSCEIFQNFSWSFSQVFDLSSTPSTTKKISGRPGARDPSAVKVSAPYDAWGPQNSRKTKIEKTRKKSKLWSAVYPPRMAPIGLRIWENAFQMIPIIWFFDTRKKNRGHFFHQKIFGREIYHYLPLFYHYLPLFYHYFTTILPLFTTIYHYFTTIYHYFTTIYHYLPLFYIQQRLKKHSIRIHINIQTLSERYWV